MQVRAFIKPDQVALMLSARDWLSDYVCKCVCVSACRYISRASHDRYVVVGKSEETFTCVTLRSFWVHRDRQCYIMQENVSRMHTIYLSERLREIACDL